MPRELLRVLLVVGGRRRTRPLSVDEIRECVEAGIDDLAGSPLRAPDVDELLVDLILRRPLLDFRSVLVRLVADEEEGEREAADDGNPHERRADRVRLRAVGDSAVRQLLPH